MSLLLLIYDRRYVLDRATVRFTQVESIFISIEIRVIKYRLYYDL